MIFSYNLIQCPWWLYGKELMRIMRKDYACAWIYFICIRTLPPLTTTTHTHSSGAGLTLSFPHRRTQAEGISWCRAVPVWGKVSDEGKVKHFFLLLLICFVLFFAPSGSYNLPSRFWNSYFHPLLVAEQVFLWGKSTKTSYLVTFLM